MRDEIEELVFQANALLWSLWYRRGEGERLERIYQRAVKRYNRRAEYLADYDQGRHEDYIESLAYRD